MAVDELYSSLNKLLEDICKFLTDETNYKNLSLVAKKHADELINRSKHQLQEIEKIIINNNNPDGAEDEAYVDMDRKSVESNKEDNIYSSVDDLILSKSPVTQSQNPYANLPARELNQNVKYGALSWKCRFILKFEKMRRVYAGLHNNWLLIYSSEKDFKPLQTFDLRFYKAHNVPNKQGKNLSQDFELISTIEEKKTYYFIALTHKDMLQWTAQINKCHDSFSQHSIPVISEDDDVSETYDTIVNAEKKDSDDDGSIYEKLEISPHHNNENLNKPPELPLRRPQKSPLPVPPDPYENNKEKLTESLSTANEAVKQSEETSEANSFSDGDDEGDYYEEYPAKVPKEEIYDASSFSEDDEEDIYDEFTGNTETAVVQNDTPKPVESINVTVQINSVPAKQKPATPAKPKFLREQPRSFLIRKK